MSDVRLTLVDVPEVGWVACEPGGSYDLCTNDALGNHDPDTRQQHPFRATQAHHAPVGTVQTPIPTDRARR